MYCAIDYFIIILIVEFFFLIMESLLPYHWARKWRMGGGGKGGWEGEKERGETYREKYNYLLYVSQFSQFGIITYLTGTTSCNKVSLIPTLS